MLRNGPCVRVYMCVCECMCERECVYLVVTTGTRTTVVVAISVAHAMYVCNGTNERTMGSEMLRAL